MALTAKKVYAILKRQISDMESKIKTPIIYKGTVATADLLPLNPPTINPSDAIIAAKAAILPNAVYGSPEP